MFFQWSLGVFGAVDMFFLVILRLKQGDYLSLPLEAAGNLRLIFQTKFRKRNEAYLPLNTEGGPSASYLSDAVAFFLEKGFIEPCTFSENRRITIDEPLEAGGLSELEWIPNTQEVSLKKTDVFLAWCDLRTVHSTLKKYSMRGVVTFLEKRRVKPIHQASQQKSFYLAKVLERASLFFYKESKCLPYAVALALLHYKMRLPCNFVIGVQSQAFLAHAWVESAGTVINDNPSLQKRMAPLFRLSNL